MAQFNKIITKYHEETIGYNQEGLCKLCDNTGVFSVPSKKLFDIKCVCPNGQNRHNRYKKIKRNWEIKKGEL